MLKKSVVLYMDGALINNAPASYEGATCEKCIFFLLDSSECELLTPAKVAPKGVCCLFVGGSPDGDTPRNLVPQKVAGYISNGPTMCGNCVKFVSPSSCEVVEGDIEESGCCNGWSNGKEPKKTKVSNSMTTNQMGKYLSESDSDYD